MSFHHVSVLLQESIEYLAVNPDGVYIDGTLGGGGHSSLICENLSPSGMLIGIDRDFRALDASGERLGKYLCQKKLCHNNFFNVKSVLQDLGVTSVDGAILDLGVSSPQLDDPERGFSYRYDARLDMRMDSTAEMDAYKVVNTYDEAKLADIIFKYGEERYARRIASAIVKERSHAPIETTFQLSEIIKKAFPGSAGFGDKHPSKRTFQAIRIEVNGELEGLGDAVRDFVDVLKPKGRLAIITFHSLEDRIVKNTFADLAKGCTCPKDFPICVCGNTPVVKNITGKPVIAGDNEMQDNRRAHSAKLRVIEKI